MRFQAISYLFFAALLSVGSAKVVDSNGPSDISSRRVHAREILPSELHNGLLARGDEHGSDGESTYTVSSTDSASQVGMNKVEVAEGKKSRIVDMNGCTAMWLFSPSTNHIVGIHVQDDLIKTYAAKGKAKAEGLKMKVEYVAWFAPDETDFATAQNELKTLFPGATAAGKLYPYVEINNAAEKQGKNPTFTFTVEMKGKKINLEKPVVTYSKKSS